MKILSLKFFTGSCQNVYIVANGPNRSVGHEFGQELPTVSIFENLGKNAEGKFISGKKLVENCLLLVDFDFDFARNCPTHFPRTGTQYFGVCPNRSEPSEKSYDHINKKKMKVIFFSKKIRVLTSFWLFPEKG